MDRHSCSTEQFRTAPHASQERRWMGLLSALAVAALLLPVPTLAGRPPAPAKAVLEPIKAEGAALILHQGDFGNNKNPTPQAAAATGKWVSGYYAGWFWDMYPPAVVDMTAMTHFIFGRYAPGGGTLGGNPGQVLEGAGAGHDSSVEQFLINKAHTAGIKALIMLGGAGDGPGFDGSTVNAAVRTTFINNILTRLSAKSYDGVDIDWEENLDTPQQQSQLVALLTELRAAAANHPHFRPPHAPIIITFPGFWTNINFKTVTPWHVAVASLVDQYNLMTYGMADAWPGWQSWHHSALADAQPTHPSSIEASIQEHAAAGIPRSKLGIGIGFYGIYYGGSVTGPRQSIGNSGSQGDDVENSYARLVGDGAFGQPGGARHWDDLARQSYYSYSPAWNRYGNTPIGFLSFEDERSIAAKGQWVKDNGVGGAIIWTINYGCTNSSTGANPLLAAVKAAFLGSATPPPTTATPSTSPTPSTPTPTMPTSTPTPATPPPTTPPSTTPPTGDHTPPSILAFTVGPATADSAVSIGWHVADSGGSHLRQIQIWRAADFEGSPDGLSWHEVRALRHEWPQGEDHGSGETSDAPPSGAWWYRVHAVDYDGNWAFWPSPIRISKLGGNGLPISFSDVLSNDWAFPYIEALYSSGYVKGCQETPLRRYCPRDPVNRAEEAVFILRGVFGASHTPPQPPSPPFDDVPLSHWAVEWISELEEQHFTKGCSADGANYCPYDYNTLAEGAVFFTRILEGSDFVPPTPAEIPFVDLSPSDWYTKWLVHAFNAGLLGPCRTGPEGASICPNEELRRDLAAYMLINAKALPIPQ